MTPFNELRQKAKRQRGQRQVHALFRQLALPTLNAAAGEQQRRGSWAFKSCGGRQESLREGDKMQETILKPFIGTLRMGIPSGRA